MIDDLTDFSGLEGLGLELDGLEVEAIAIGDLDSPEVLTDAELDIFARVVDRSTSAVSSAEIGEVSAYLTSAVESPEQLVGLENSLVGIHGEFEACAHLNELDDGLTYQLSELTNQPDADIVGVDATGNVVRQIQVKMSTDVAYVEAAFDDVPAGVEVLTGTEVAATLGDSVIDVGVSAVEVREDVEAAIHALTDTSHELVQAIQDPALVSFAESNGLWF